MDRASWVTVRVEATGGRVVVSSTTVGEPGVLVASIGWYRENGWFEGGVTNRILFAEEGTFVQVSTDLTGDHQWGGMSSGDGEQVTAWTELILNDLSGTNYFLVQASGDVSRWNWSIEGAAVASMEQGDGAFVFTAEDFEHIAFAHHRERVLEDVFGGTRVGAQANVHGRLDLTLQNTPIVRFYPPAGAGGPTYGAAIQLMLAPDRPYVCPCNNVDFREPEALPPGDYTFLLDTAHLVASAGDAMLIVVDARLPV